MKLSHWAKSQGLSYRTAWRMWKDGTLPTAARQLPTGTIIVDDPKSPQVGSVALYVRVSSADQKNDLERQAGRLTAFATSKGLQVSAVVSEIGSGLNGHRPKLLKLLASADVKTIMVEHRERLARFGVEYLQMSLAASGRTLLVMDEAEIDDDLVKDMIDVLTSFCARLYGKRSAKNRAQKAFKAASTHS